MNSKALNQTYSKGKKIKEEEEGLLNKSRNRDPGQDIEGQISRGVIQCLRAGNDAGQEKKMKRLQGNGEFRKETEKHERVKERAVSEKSGDVRNEAEEAERRVEKPGEKDGTIVNGCGKRVLNDKEERPPRNEPEVEKYASLAQPEFTGDDDLSVYFEDKLHQEAISLHENFESQAGCREYFDILDKTMEAGDSNTSGNSCGQTLRVVQDLPCYESDIAKMFDEKYPAEEVESSLHASLRSVSTCRDSLSSTKETHRSRCNLTLDLECRICHDNEGKDLISPCYCAGTSKWVHEACIIRWIRHTKTKQCEICTCPITVKRKKKPIEQWTRPSASCGPCNKLDIWYCFVVALCVFIIIGFVILQNRYDITEQTETTVIFASIYVLCGMIIMMKIRYFWTWFVHRSSFWGNWKNLNEEWKIVEANEASATTPESPV